MNVMRRKDSSVKERQEILGIGKAKGKVRFLRTQAIWPVVPGSQQ